MAYDTEADAKNALRDARRVVSRAIEGGLLDGIETSGGSDWRWAYGAQASEVKRRVEALLEGTGVELRFWPKRRTEFFQLRVQNPWGLWLQEKINGAIYRVDGQGRLA